MVELRVKLMVKVRQTNVYARAIRKSDAYVRPALGIPMSYGYGSAMPPLKTGSGPGKQARVILR